VRAALQPQARPARLQLAAAGWSVLQPAEVALAHLQLRAAGLARRPVAQAQAQPPAA
jgi:hypothetical protein